MRLERSTARALISLAAMVACLLPGPRAAQAAAPPFRSTLYNGFTAPPSNFGSSSTHDPTVAMTIEAWVFRQDESRCETVVGRNYSSSYWLGFCNNRLRFYRSGGAFADADVNVAANAWSHIAAVYDE